MSDVKLFSTPDDFDIEVINGTVTMDDGFETAFYLSLFGGNEDDPGGSDLSKQWWGNSLDDNVDTHYRSRTQYLLRMLPQNSANLNAIKQAVYADLAWSSDQVTISDIFVSVPRLNWLSIEVVTPDGSLMYTSPWEVH